MNDDLVQSMADRAEALFANREMYCGEAIMTALNEGLGGGLEHEQARGLAIGFGEGIGKAGCLCGALGGAVLAASWFLSRGLDPQEVRDAAREVHDRFKKEHGSSCCRVLIKHVKTDPPKHFAQCTGLTRKGAELAARVILSRLPELASGAAPPRKPSRLASLLRRLAAAVE